MAVGPSRSRRAREGPGLVRPHRAAAEGGFPRVTRPDPPPGARNFVLLVLDSCRYDAFVAASPRTMSRIGEVERRYSYASWTSPAHFNLLMGLLPHRNPRHVFASTYYKQELAGLAHRLGIPEMGFVDMVTKLWLPHFLRSTLDYVRAVVSMPVLNGHTPRSGL